MLADDFAFARRRRRPHGLGYVQEELLLLPHSRRPRANLCAQSVRRERTVTRTDSLVRVSVRTYGDGQALERLGLCEVELHLPRDGIALEEQRRVFRICCSALDSEGDPFATTLVLEHIAMFVPEPASAYPMSS